MTDSNRALNSTPAPYWSPLPGEGDMGTSAPPDARGAVPVPGPFVPPTMRGSVNAYRSVHPKQQATPVMVKAVPAHVEVQSPASIQHPIEAAAEEASTVAQAGDDLPWIETFLKTGSQAAIKPLVEAPLEPSEPRPPVAQTSLDEIWPLDDAGREMTELAQELSSHEAHESSTDIRGADDDSSLLQFSSEIAAANTPQGSLAPLPMWNDEEWMDIMPMSPPKLPNGTSMPTEPSVAERPWADVAREEATRRGEVESAATALEALAQRVRSGELPLPGYQASLGDAAALAAALAALLGVRG